MNNPSTSFMLEYIRQCAAHETVECLCQGEYWANKHSLRELISLDNSSEVMDTEARDAVRATFPPFIQDVFQIKKITVMTAISIGTLISNLVILITILTRHGKVIFRFIVYK